MTDREGMSTAETEVVDLCRELIAIDTSNYGDHSGPGEREAAEYVAAKLDEVGLEATIYESHPKRSSVVARIEGTDPSRPPLLVQGHLDVVPADPADWTHHPFSGEVADGCVWGRGAIDMKDMDAMVLAVVRQRMREGRRPPRDIVLAFLADEEAGGTHGAHWLVEKHPDLFADCTEAISEVGGFSITVNENRRLYLIETAEKGLAWMRLTARGTAGHGSMVNNDNAITELAAAVARLGQHKFPVRLTPAVRTFLEEVCAEFGIEFRDGLEKEFFAEIDRLLGPKVTREFIQYLPAVQTEFTGGIVTAMTQALQAEDAGAKAVPYCMSGGTDAKAFMRLGIRNFGFVPLRLPPGLDFAGMFHGVDERVPVDALQFGVRVLDRFFDLA